MRTLLSVVLSLLLTTAATAAVLPPKSPGHHRVAPPPSQSEAEQQSKYFHEAGGSLELGHYDARFFRGVVPYESHGPALRHLIRSWLTTARALGVETWLAHGTLLGWWWNGRVMPWDYDLDVQMPTAMLVYLGRHFNRTVWDYRFLSEEEEEEGGLKWNGGNKERGEAMVDAGNGDGDGGDGDDRGEAYDGYINKTYLLDVNPHHADIGRGNGHNIIDARWIDVSNGLFIDITGLAERDPAKSPGVWSCKNAHKYRTAELYPVRHTEFEGVPASVPYAFDKILMDEYGSKSLVNTEWAGHHWVPELKEWVKNPKLPEDEEVELDTQHQGGTAVVVKVEKTVVKEAPKSDHA
ncbi:LicD family-domain-containing protein [Hypoxylon sp. FL0543]|nr:LicD family-domain-containing protein [Hypoxylon sp. FL0543]